MTTTNTERICKDRPHAMKNRRGDTMDLRPPRVLWVEARAQQFGGGGISTAEEADPPCPGKCSACAGLTRKQKPLTPPRSIAAQVPQNSVDLQRRPPRATMAAAKRRPSLAEVATIPDFAKNMAPCPSNSRYS